MIAYRAVNCPAENGRLDRVAARPPPVALEFARRAVPAHVRPTFQELEKAYRGKP